MAEQNATAAAECRVLVVSPSPGRLANFLAALSSAAGLGVQQADRAEAALERVAENKPDLVVVDEKLRDLSAAELLRRLLSVDAFLSTAVLSGLAEEEAHEAYEGLGVLAHLPLEPGRREALKLIEHWRSVSGALA